VISCGFYHVNPNLIRKYFVLDAATGDFSTDSIIVSQAIIYSVGFFGIDDQQTGIFTYLPHKINNIVTITKQQIFYKNETIQMV